MSAWNAIYKLALVILGLLVLACVGFAFKKPLQERQALIARRSAAEQAVRQQQDKLDDLKHRQELLQTDPRFVEKIAREEFGYSKPGEVVFRVEGAPATRKH